MDNIDKPNMAGGGPMISKLAQMTFEFHDQLINLSDEFFRQISV